MKSTTIFLAWSLVVLIERAAATSHAGEQPVTESDDNEHEDEHVDSAYAGAADYDDDDLGQMEMQAVFNEQGDVDIHNGAKESPSPVENDEETLPSDDIPENMLGIKHDTDEHEDATEKENENAHLAYPSKEPKPPGENIEETLLGVNPEEDDHNHAIEIGDTSEPPAGSNDDNVDNTIDIPSILTMPSMTTEKMLTTPSPGEKMTTKSQEPTHKESEGNGNVVSPKTLPKPKSPPANTPPKVPENTPPKAAGHRLVASTIVFHLSLSLLLGNLAKNVL